MNIKSIDFWSSIEIGSELKFSDELSLTKSVARGNGATDMIYAIKSMTCMRESSGLAEYNFMELIGDADEMVLMIKIVDDLFDLRFLTLSERPDGTLFSPGNRKEQVEVFENQFLFEEPKDVDNIVYKNLKYANSITIGNVLYSEKYPELHGKVKYIPEKSGLVGISGIVKEYGGVFIEETDETLVYPDLVIFEQGKSQNGGLVSLYKGYTLSLDKQEVTL